MNKKKIAMIIDVRGWAFDNIAHKIKENLPEYDIDIIPGDLFEGNMIQLFLLCQDYDLIHFLWRGFLTLIDREEMKNYVQTLGETFEDFVNQFIKNKNITFTVCDQLFLNKEEEWKTFEAMKYAKSYFVTSKILMDIYNKYEKKPSMIIHDGVDLKQYKPENLDRFNNITNIRVGWAGNSKFKDNENDTDLKGVEGIIKPAISELQNEGYDIELKLADRNIKKIPQEEMPKFYNNIDLYVCASKTEGTPLTVLEAMAMGIPVISTDVGIVKEALGPNGSKYIMKERSKDELKSKIKELINNKKDFEIISKENLEQIKDWDWEKISKKYKEFFELNMK